MSIKSLTIKLLLALSLFAAHTANAGPFTLPQLDVTQLDPLFRTLANTMVFRPVQGADSASVFGFGLGLTFQMTSAAPISSFVTGTTYVAAPDLNAVVQFPMGFGVELGYLPNLNMSGTSLTRFGGALKWTMTKSVLSALPFAVALRALYTTSNMSYTQAISGGTVNVAYNSNITGATLSVSKSLVFIEPYISYGLVSHNSSLSGSGTSNLFNGTIPGQSASGTGSSGFLQIGAELKLLVLNLGIEYGSLYGADSYAARVGFKF